MQLIVILEIMHKSRIQTRRTTNKCALNYNKQTTGGQNPNKQIKDKDKQKF